LLSVNACRVSLRILHEKPTAQREDDGPATASVLENFGLEIVQAQNLLILHTTMGGAQPVAAALDSEPWEEIVGTIAGDNAVLIVCPDNAGAAALKTRIETYLA
jgi:transcriptional regulator of arginine metabolism